VASAAVASRMTCAAVSREVASTAGRWQVQQGGGKCSREVASAAGASMMASGAGRWPVEQGDGKCSSGQ
jgi:hypothetical protein